MKRPSDHRYHGKTCASCGEINSVPLAQELPAHCATCGANLDFQRRRRS